MFKSLIVLSFIGCLPSLAEARVNACDEALNHQLVKTRIHQNGENFFDIGDKTDQVWSQISIAKAREMYSCGESGQSFCVMGSNANWLIYNGKERKYDYKRTSNKITLERSLADKVVINLKTLTYDKLYTKRLLNRSAYPYSPYIPLKDSGKCIKVLPSSLKGKVEKIFTEDTLMAMNEKELFPVGQLDFNYLVDPVTLNAFQITKSYPETGHLGIHDLTHNLGTKVKLKELTGLTAINTNAISRYVIKNGSPVQEFLKSHPKEWKCLVNGNLAKKSYTALRMSYFTRVNFKSDATIRLIGNLTLLEAGWANFQFPNGSDRSAAIYADLSSGQSYVLAPNNSNNGIKGISAKEANEKFQINLPLISFEDTVCY